jgi:hypothetical protein
VEARSLQKPRWPALILPAVFISAGCGNGSSLFANRGADPCSVAEWWYQTAYPFTVCGEGHVDPEGSCSYPDDAAHDGAAIWWDTDLAVAGDTPIQLRHDATLVDQVVTPWGWQPTFDDLLTGRRFSFLHLHPTDAAGNDARYTTVVGAVYVAGTIVGLSGGDSADTGFPTYSSGAHLCVQTIDYYRDTIGPSTIDPCSAPRVQSSR